MSIAAPTVIRRGQLYIDGAWVASDHSETIEVIGAATEEVMGVVPSGSTEDIERAVQAARRAFPAWSAKPVEKRAQVLRKISEGLRERASEIASVISSEVGMPINLSVAIQAGLPVTTSARTADLVVEVMADEEVGNSLIVREPIGVVAAITPWNYPLHQAVAKVAPALATGCTVVLKPSQIAPLSLFILAEICDSACLPAGVLNVVSGRGSVIGERLAAHPDVDMISFTGSTQAGRRVAAVAAETVKKVALELGGKSANVLLDDADFARAVPAGVSNLLLNSGQTCSAWSRMLVPRSRQEEALEYAVAQAGKLKLGDPLDPATRLGPLASNAQRETVRDYVGIGLAEGARLVTGGAEAPQGLDRGYYVRPTVFADVTTGMRIAQEEIFGPVLCVMPYDSDDDAAVIANDSSYGLAGAVWSADGERAVAFARRMRTGQVDVNGGKFNPAAPFGGYRQSGLGRELGRFGIEEFLEVKSLQR